MQAPESSELAWDRCNAGLQSLCVALLCKKNKKEDKAGKGFARSRSDA